MLPWPTPEASASQLGGSTTPSSAALDSNNNNVSDSNQHNNGAGAGAAAALLPPSNLSGGEGGAVVGIRSHHPASGHHSALPTMPVGSVQGQNPTQVSVNRVCKIISVEYLFVSLLFICFQGLVHWMSAVMAEHMTSNTHHDPTVGMHYMWNGGGVDVSL